MDNRNKAHTPNRRLAKVAVQCSADPEVSGWLIKHWYSASTLVVKIATFAKPQNVVRHAMGTLLTLNIWTNDNHFLTIPSYKINIYTFDNDKN